MTTQRTAGVPGCDTDTFEFNEWLIFEIMEHREFLSWLDNSIIPIYLTQHSTSCMGSLEGTKIGSPSRLDFGSDDKKVHCMGVLK